MEEKLPAAAVFGHHVQLLGGLKRENQGYNERVPYLSHDPPLCHCVLNLCDTRNNSSVRDIVLEAKRPRGYQIKGSHLSLYMCACARARARVRVRVSTYTIIYWQTRTWLRRFTSLFLTTFIANTRDGSDCMSPLM